MAIASNCTLYLFFNNKLNSNSNSVFFDNNWKNDTLMDYWSDLEIWLTNHSVNYFKQPIVYVKPELNMTINIKLNQNDINKQDCVWNYASILWPNDEQYFYYVNAVDWISRNTVQLSLSLDTLSTYWIEIINNLTNKTTVFREHKDRFFKQDKITVGTSLLRKIDPKSEGINAPVKQVKSIDTIHTNTSGVDYKWYLIYKTNNNNSIKPIETYLCASKELILSQYEQSIMTSDLDQTSVVYIAYGEATLVTLGSTYEIDITNKPGALLYNQDKWWFFYYDSTGTRNAVNDVVSITFLNNTLSYYIMDINHYQEVYAALESYYPDINYVRFVEYDDQILKHNLGGIIKSIDQVDRTYSNLNAIIECPYCPTSNVVVDNTGVITYLNTNILEYVRGQDLIRIKDVNNEFYNEIVRELGIPNMIYTIDNLEAIDDTFNDNPDLESKLYHSDYNSLFIQYDNWNIPIKRELIETTTNPTVKLTYKQSNQMSSNCLFQVDGENCDIKETNINELMMLSQRNNELTIYQSNYLNYMRTGYNYDKKQNSLLLSSSIINAVSNTITGGVSLGLSIANIKSNVIQAENDYNQKNRTTIRDYFKVRHDPRISDEVFERARVKYFQDLKKNKSDYKNAIFNNIGVGTQLAIQNSSGIISSWVNVAQTKILQDIEMERKKSEYLSQSATTSGANDLDLFKFYNGDNKLKLINMDVLDNTKLAIKDMLYYMGYIDNTQHIPDTNSRVHFNFIQMNPDFVDCKIFDNYKQDIIARLNTGVTIWHDDNEYGLNNIERWLKDNL